MVTVSVKNLGSNYRMGKTRLPAEVDSETLDKAREIPKSEQITLDDTLQEMLNHIVGHDTAPCFKCGDPNPETLPAMTEAEAGDLTTAYTIAGLFADLNLTGAGGLEPPTSGSRDQRSGH